MGRRQPILAAVLCVIVALAVAAGEGPPADARPLADATKTKKKKPANRLAGRWEGTTKPTSTYSGPAAPVTYRITKSGQVLDFTTTVTTNKTPGGGEECATPIQVTATLPPVKLFKPDAYFPKGKRFEYRGFSGSPAASLQADGKVAPPYKPARSMEGGLTMGMGSTIVTPSGPCRTGAVYWSARRIRG